MSSNGGLLLDNRAPERDVSDRRGVLQGSHFKTMTRLILVRHGQTASNGVDPDPRLSGWTDLPLSPVGRKQIRALQRRLLQGPLADALYSSPLERARDTAHAIVCASQTALRLLDDLREIGCGQVDGMPISQVKRFCPELWQENLRQDNAGFRWPGGESYREFRERCLKALRTIVSAHPAQRVILVTHAGFVSQVLGALHGLSPACWGYFRPENASLTELDWWEKGSRVVSFNDYAHLTPADSRTHS